MAKLPSPATAVVLAGLTVASTLLLAFLWRKSRWPSRNSTESQLLPSSCKRQPSPRCSVDTSNAERFEEACKAVESSAGDLPNFQRLQLYALFKQATQGNCEDEEPSLRNPVAHSKWSAWRANKGVTKEDARASYVELALQLGILQLASKTHNSERKGFGQVQSKPVMADRQDGSKTLYRSKGDRFCCLAAEGEFEQMKNALSEEAALVNVTGDDRMTALHLTADRGFVGIVRLLIDYGADVNHVDDCGETPLHVAIAADQHEVISLLLKAGADTTIKNNDGYSCAELLAQGKEVGR